MNTMTRRATVYFQPAIHRALRNKASQTDRSISQLINEAVNVRLREDAEDLASFAKRAHEPDLEFNAVVKDLKRRGKL